MKLHLKPKKKSKILNQKNKKKTHNKVPNNCLKER